MSDDEKLAYEVLRSLRRIMRRVGAHSRSLRRDAGVTVPQLLCLRAISDATSPGERTLKAIAQRVGLSPPTTSGIIDRLAKAGYVDRGRDERDRRRIVLRLTDSGRTQLEESPRPLQDDFVTRLMQLPPSERSELLDALRRVVELMDASSLDASPLLDADEVSATAEELDV